MVRVREGSSGLGSTQLARIERTGAFLTSALILLVCYVHTRSMLNYPNFELDQEAIS